MDIDELLALLGIDTPSELAYFEQFADLIETPQDIPFETLSALFDDVEPDVLSELTEAYFEDIIKCVPDAEDELFTLLTNIGTTLKSLAGSGDDDAARAFTEELYRFRSWYLFDSCVFCTDLNEGTESDMGLMEALTNYRAQNFTDSDYVFDFNDALDYPLDEYIVSLDALLEDDYGDGDTYGEDEDYRDPDD